MAPMATCEDWDYYSRHGTSMLVGVRVGRSIHSRECTLGICHSANNRWTSKGERGRE